MKVLKFMSFALLSMALIACGGKKEETNSSDSSASGNGSTFNVEKSTITGNNADLISFANGTVKFEVIPSSNPDYYTTAIMVPVKLNKTVKATGFTSTQPELSVTFPDGQKFQQNIYFGKGSGDASSAEKAFIEFLGKEPGAVFDMPFYVYASFTKEQAESMNDLNGASLEITGISVNIEETPTQDDQNSDNTDQPQGGEGSVSGEGMGSAPGMGVENGMGSPSGMGVEPGMVEPGIQNPAASNDGANNVDALINEFQKYTEEFIRVYRNEGPYSPQLQTLDAQLSKIGSELRKANLTRAQEQKIQSIESEVQNALGM